MQATGLLPSDLEGLGELFNYFAYNSNINFDFDANIAPKLQDLINELNTRCLSGKVFSLEGDRLSLEDKGRLISLFSHEVTQTCNQFMERFVRFSSKDFLDQTKKRYSPLFKRWADRQHRAGATTLDALKPQFSLMDLTITKFLTDFNILDKESDFVLLNTVEQVRNAGLDGTVAYCIFLHTIGFYQVVFRTYERLSGDLFSKVLFKETQLLATKTPEENKRCLSRVASFLKREDSSAFGQTDVVSSPLLKKFTTTTSSNNINSDSSSDAEPDIAWVPSSWGNYLGASSRNFKFFEDNLIKHWRKEQYQRLRAEVERSLCSNRS